MRFALFSPHTHSPDRRLRAMIRNLDAATHVPSMPFGPSDKVCVKVYVSLTGYAKISFNLPLERKPLIRATPATTRSWRITMCSCIWKISPISNADQPRECPIRVWLVQVLVKICVQTAQYFLFGMHTYTDTMQKNTRKRCRIGSIGTLQGLLLSLPPIMTEWNIHVSRLLIEVSKIHARAHAMNDEFERVAGWLLVVNFAVLRSAIGWWTRTLCCL